MQVFWPGPPPQSGCAPRRPPDSAAPVAFQSWSGPIPHRARRGSLRRVPTRRPPLRAAPAARSGRLHWRLGCKRTRCKGVARLWSGGTAGAAVRPQTRWSGASRLAGPWRSTSALVTAEVMQGRVVAELQGQQIHLARRVGQPAGRLPDHSVQLPQFFEKNCNRWRPLATVNGRGRIRGLSGVFG